MQYKIAVEKREIKGKKLNKLRKQGLVPAVIFDSKTNTQNISIRGDLLTKVLRGASATTIFEVVIDNVENKAIIKELQTDPVTDNIIHVTFFKIDEKAEMDFELPIVTKGIAPAVKNNLGVLVQTMESIMIRCKPGDLVDNLTADISLLDHPGQTMKLKELTLPKGIKLVHAEDIERTIITITELQKEEEVKAVVPAAGETVEGDENVDKNEVESNTENEEASKDKDKSDKK